MRPLAIPHCSKEHLLKNTVPDGNMIVVGVNLRGVVDHSVLVLLKKKIHQRKEWKK